MPQHRTETLEGLVLPGPSFPSFSPIPTAHSHLGFGRIKAQSLFRPPSQPNWQLLACCLCPDMAEGHRQLGDAVDFPFGSGEEGEGRGSPPP